MGRKPARKRAAPVLDQEDQPEDQQSEDQDQGQGQEHDQDDDQGASASAPKPKGTAASKRRKVESKSASKPTAKAERKPFKLTEKNATKVVGVDIRTIDYKKLVVGKLAAPASEKAKKYKINYAPITFDKKPLKYTIRCRLQLAPKPYQGDNASAESLTLSIRPVDDAVMKAFEQKDAYYASDEFKKKCGKSANIYSTKWISPGKPKDKDLHDKDPADLPAGTECWDASVRIAIRHEGEKATPIEDTVYDPTHQGKPEIVPITWQDLKRGNLLDIEIHESTVYVQNGKYGIRRTAIRVLRIGSREVTNDGPSLLHNLDNLPNKDPDAEDEDTTTTTDKPSLIETKGKDKEGAKDVKENKDLKTVLAAAAASASYMPPPPTSSSSASASSSTSAAASTSTTSSGSKK